MRKKTDSELQRDVVAELKWDPVVREKVIAVAVKDGVVTLGGFVDGYPQKFAAERAAMEAIDEAVRKAPLLDRGVVEEGQRHRLLDLVGMGAGEQHPGDHGGARFLAADATRTIRMEVAGLVCGFCAQGIDKQMRSFDATRDVYVNLERGVVAVELDPGEDIADEVLDQALTDAGYTLTGITRVERPLAEVRRDLMWSRDNAARSARRGSGASDARNS